jgi:2,3-bisphosphoglycerate-independent phosphoglycerate mutase
VSFNGMGLSDRELKEIAGLFNHFAHTIEFLHLSDYRNLLIMNRKEAVLDVTTAPPHESMGMIVDELLAALKDASLEMKVFTEEADRMLQKYSRNDLTYRLYPWGASCRTEIPSFRTLHGIDGAVVGQTEIVRGIGKALGMEVPELQYCTADIDTDVREKLAVTRRMLEQYPFVLVHFNGTDEAAHRHDYEGKAQFISRIDREFLGPLLEHGTDPLRILICGDHVTSSVTGRHTRGRGPVVAAVLGGTGPAAPLRNYHDMIEFMRKVGEQHG